MAQQWTDYRVFLKEFRDTFGTTGAVLPTGGAACRAMCRFVAEDRPECQNGNGQPHARQILEVGPGTGAITDHLLRRLRPTDQVTLVELNERFVERLQGRLNSESDWMKVANRVKLVAGSVEDLPAEPKFDVIVSALPFNNFPPELVCRLLENLFSRLSPQGTLTFIEYIAIRRFKELMASSAERRRLRQVGDILSNFVAKHAFGRDRVLANVPPAWVHHVSPTGSILPAGVIPSRNGHGFHGC